MRTGADAYAFASTVARAAFFLALLVTHLALPTFMARARAQLEPPAGVRRHAPPPSPAGAAAVRCGRRRGAALVRAPAASATTRRSSIPRHAAAARPRVGADVDPAAAHVLPPRPAPAARVRAGRRRAVLSLLAGLRSSTRLARSQPSCSPVAVATVTVMGLPASQRVTPVTPRRARGTRIDAGASRHDARRRSRRSSSRSSTRAPTCVVDTVAGWSSTLTRTEGSSTASSRCRTAAPTARPRRSPPPGSRTSRSWSLPREPGQGRGAPRRPRAACAARSSATSTPTATSRPSRSPASSRSPPQTGADAVVGSKVHPDSHLDVERYRAADVGGVPRSRCGSCSGSTSATPRPA